MRRERVGSAEDPRLADYRGVRDPVRLRRDGVFLAEGRHAVEVLLTRSRLEARSLALTPTSVAWLEAAPFRCPEDLPVYEVEPEVLAALGGHRFHQGCLAAGTRPPPRDVEALLAETASPARLVVLHDVSNPDNVGAVLRSAAAFGCGGALLTEGAASPLYRKAIRASMGAALTTPFAHGGEGPGTVRALRDAGYAVLALTPAPDACPLERWMESGLPARLALLLGSEGHGLDRATEDAATARVRIPVTAAVESLNVAAAAAVALYATRPA